MASINGIQFKSVKYYIGHEGESCLQASLYMDGKRVGICTEETWSGEYEYMITAKGVTDAMVDSKLFVFAESRGYHSDYTHNRTLLLERLKTLVELEAVFKKTAKKYKNFALVAADVDYRLSLMEGVGSINVGYRLCPNQPENIAAAKQALTEDTKNVALVFTSLADFDWTI